MNSIVIIEPDIGRSRRVRAIKAFPSIVVGREPELLEGDES